MTRAILITLFGLAALIALPLVANVAPISAQAGETVRIMARLQADGDIEFGLRTSAGRQLPRARIFAASVRDNGWKISSLIEVPDGTQVRIIARRSGNARVEFGLRIDEPRQVFLPPRRQFSRATPVGEWRFSSAIALPPREQATQPEPPANEVPEPPPTEPDEPEPPPEPPEEETDDTGTEESDEASDVERISGGPRDGLIVEGNIVGNPDAPVLIVEYGDPF